MLGPRPTENCWETIPWGAIENGEKLIPTYIAQGFSIEEGEQFCPQGTLGDVWGIYQD